MHLIPKMQALRKSCFQLECQTFLKILVGELQGVDELKQTLKVRVILKCEFQLENRPNVQGFHPTVTL